MSQTRHSSLEGRAWQNDRNVWTSRVVSNWITADNGLSNA